jgi:hypothetical protein
MRSIILVAVLLSFTIGWPAEAPAQMDCRAVIQHLNDTLKVPGVFDVDFFVGKYGLDYASCAAPQGAVYCFKCLYEAGTKPVEIVISDNGLLVSHPRDGCRCGPDVKWKQSQ